MKFSVLPYYRGEKFSRILGYPEGHKGTPSSPKRTMSTPFHRSLSELVRKECCETLSWVASSHPVEFRAYSATILDEALDSQKVAVIAHLIGLGIPTNDSHLMKAFKLGNASLFKILSKAHPQEQTPEGAYIAKFLEALQGKDEPKETTPPVEVSPEVPPTTEKKSQEASSPSPVEKLMKAALPYLIEGFLTPKTKVESGLPPQASSELNIFASIVAESLRETQEKKD